MKKYGFFSAFKDLFKYTKDNKKQYIFGTIFMIFLDDEDIINACKLANIDDFIDKLPNKYEDFDNIIMLEDGKIVEQGKHSELINNHGKYYELANI